jgi:spermidine/putrescine transport system ATP-binding protein
MMTEIDIQLDRVTKRFKKVTAVDNVSFTIPKGSFFSLLGPSGCGKTTVLRMISGFEEPSTGQILIRGRDMSGVPPFKRPTNLVFQHLALFPHLTVTENISFGLEMKKKSRTDITRAVGEMLELVELPGFGKRKIDQLSGGQKQRVAIARALVNKPTVILLDEPLGALDLKLRNQLQLELKRIQREIGTTFVYVTHDQSEAITMSDHIAVMNKGRVEQIGPSRKIYEQPETVFVAGFIGETNLIEGTLVDKTNMIHCESGMQILVKPGPPFQTGKVMVNIRREKIRMGQNAENLDNRFEGRVVDMVYQGDSSTYTVLVAEQTILTVTQQNSDAGKIFKKGQPVVVGWPIENGIVIQEADNG